MSGVFMKSRAVIYLYVFLLLAVVAVGVGCSKTPDDAQVTQQVQSKLNADSGLQGKGVNVQTSAGVVTLSGTVDNDNERTAAARYASEVPGVKQVVNNLEVGSGSPVQQAAEAPAPQSEPAQPARKPRASTPRRHHVSDSGDSDVTTTHMNSAPSNQMASSAPPVQTAPPPPPAPRKVSIASGTTIAVRLVDAINSETA